MGRAQAYMVDPTQISDAATLSAGSAAAGFPVDNLQDSRLGSGRSWRSVGLVNTEIDFDFGADESITAIAFNDHNLKADTDPTITIEAADDAAFTVNKVTVVNAEDIFSGWWGYGEAGYGEHGYGGFPLPADQVDFDHIYFRKWAEVIRRYWRVKITDSSNSDGYIQIGRMGLELGIELPFYQYPVAMRPLDPSRVVLTEGGGKKAARKKKLRMWILNFNALEMAEYAHILERIEQRQGITEAYYLMLDVQDNPESWVEIMRMYGTSVKLPGFNHRAFKRGQWILQVQQVRGGLV
jgi:hypothetical protein